MKANAVNLHFLDELFLIPYILTNFLFSFMIYHQKIEIDETLPKSTQKMTSFWRPETNFILLLQNEWISDFENEFSIICFMTCENVWNIADDNEKCCTGRVAYWERGLLVARIVCQVQISQLLQAVINKR